MPQLTPDDITRLTSKADSLRLRIKELKDMSAAPGEAEDARLKAIRVREKQVSEIEALLPKETAK